eukprot:5186799-Prymnesium_polylepis.3
MLLSATSSSTTGSDNKLLCRPKLALMIAAPLSTGTSRHGTLLCCTVSTSGVVDTTCACEVTAMIDMSLSCAET